MGRIKKSKTNAFHLSLYTFLRMFYILVLYYFYGKARESMPFPVDAELAILFIQSKGNALAFYEVNAPSIGWYQVGTDVILVNNKLEGDALWGAVGHELAHATGLDEAIPFDSAELQADMEAYYEAASPRYKKYLKTNKKTWEREGRARMVQRFFEDSDFRDSLKQSNPTMWENIREAILKFIGQWAPEDAARKKVLEELRAAKKPNAQASPVVTASNEPTADEIDAMMDEIMSKMEESQKAEPKKPSAAKPRKYQPSKKSEKTEATAEEKRAKAKKAMRDAFKDSQGKLTMGLDMAVVAKVAEAAKLYIEAEILDFKAFVESLAEDFSEEWVRDKAGYLESAWRVANKRGWVNSPVGEVAKILPAIESTTAKFAKGDKVLVGNKAGEIVMPPQFVEKTGTYRALVRLVDKDGKAYEQFHDVDNISADSKSDEPREQVEKPTYKELRLGFEDYKTTNRLSSGAGSPALWQQVKQVDGESVFTYYVVDTTNESIVLSTSDYDQAKASWDKQTELFNVNKARERDRLYEESEKISKAKKKAISDDLENRKSQDAQTVSAQDLDKPLTGKPIIVTGFHGSKEVFEEFDPSRRGETDPGFLGPAYYFYADEALAKQHGENVIRRDLRINKPLDYAQMMAAKVGSPLREVNERYDEVYDRELDIALAQERKGLGAQPAYWRARAAALATVAKEFGYDGVVMRGGVVDDFPSTEIAVFDPPQQTKASPSAQPDKLKQYGLKVERVGSRWVVSGKTFSNKQILKDVGGQYDVSEKNWWFRSDPTDEIAAQLPDKGDGEQSGDGGDSDADVERKRVRSREAERPDERGTRDSVVESVGDDTKQLIQRGEKFGIPKKVLEGQVEDIGRVTQAFEASKPMFLVGSAPGMGKSFILGGSIAEIRKRIKANGGTPRFIYVTENQELIGQLKRDLADYGVEDVEFVTYAGVRGKRPNANGSVVLVDEAHNAKNLETKNGEAIQSMVSESDFTVYATATPFENVAEAKYLEASGVFDGVEAVIKRKDDGGKPYDATIVGFDAWAFAYGAELYWPKNAPRPVIYWHKHTTAEEGQIQANDWMAARGVYTQRPMVLPPEMVKSDLRAVTVDDKYAEMFEDVLGAYAEAEANAENAMEAGMIRAHGINLQKRILEASKVNEGIARAKDLIADGKQVIIFVNTKADRAIGRYKLSEPYRKHHGIKGEAAEKLYAPSQIADMMDEYQLAKRASREMGGDAGPAPFAKPVAAIAEAMGSRGIDFSLPSVTDELLSAFPDGKSVEYTGRLTDAKAKDNLGQWKSGKAKVIVATMDKGGTGLSYHDTTGKMPERVQVNINLPWSGTQVEQVSGRLARLGTAKPVGIEWIFADNIPFERELSKTVGSRMRSMQAAVQGSLGDMAQSIKDFEFGDAPSVPEVTPQQIRELKQRVGELNEQGEGEGAYEADLQLRDAKEKLAQQRLDAGEPYTIVCVACGDKKKGYRAAAQDLYDGDLFKKSRVWAEQNSDEWVIASAKHGLLEPGTFVDPYNKKLGASAGDKSAAASLFAVGPHLPKNLFENGKYKPQAVRVVILGGKDYVDAVKSLLPDSVIVEEPLQGKQIGERLQWLKQQNESRDRVQQIQDAFPLNREQAITADILMDAMALPGEIEIALPGTPIPGDSLS